MKYFRREHYRMALASGDEAQLAKAYSDAGKRAYDMRFRPETRAVAREYLPKLTKALRAISEEKLK